MARPLVMPQPSSAVARLLEPGIGRAALAEPGRDAPRDLPAPTPTGETPDIKREFILTGSADATLREAVSILSRATGTDVTNSHFLRSLLKVLAAALPEIEREAARTGRLKRPGNARGREAERESYERRLAEALLAGMAAVGNRAAPPPVGPGAVGDGASPASGGPVPSGVRKRSVLRTRSAALQAPDAARSAATPGRRGCPWPRPGSARRSSHIPSVGPAAAESDRPPAGEYSRGKRPRRQRAASAA